MINNSVNQNLCHNDVAIKLEGISKCFQIYEQPHHRLLQGLFRGRKQFYKEFWALNDISFEVKRGETVGIIGRNGAGKSTLLQIICGTLSQTSGAVEVHGRVAALLELGAGFNPEFTGRENVFMSGTILGLTEAEIENKFDEISAFADIGDFIEQPVKTYSSGMYVRLAFAVIAHVNADILIIDEALSVGDAYFTQKCMRFLRAFREKGTLLFVSHDTASVVNFCHEAIWLNQGTVKRTGSAKEVTEAYLEGLVEASQGESINANPDSDVKEQDPSSNSETKFWDQRLALINNSPFRNDLEIFKFDENAASFGKGGAKILDVKLCNKDDKPLSWVVGGEVVVLNVRATAKNRIEGPIIGFLLKDKLGQKLFGDTTFTQKYENFPLVVKKGQLIFSKFKFRMPLLPVGDYSIAVALAEGSLEKHIQHHWIHDALIFRSVTSSVVFGLVGLPMLNIEIKKTENES